MHTDTQQNDLLSLIFFFPKSWTYAKKRQKQFILAWEVKFHLIRIKGISQGILCNSFSYSRNNKLAAVTLVLCDTSHWLRNQCASRRMKAHSHVAETVMFQMVSSKSSFFWPLDEKNLLSGGRGGRCSLRIAHRVLPSVGMQKVHIVILTGHRCPH